MADEQDSEAAKGNGSLFRRFAVVPATLIGSITVVFVLASLTRAVLPLFGASPGVAEGIAQAVGLFFGGASFVAIGIVVAPTRKRRTGWTLFSVYLVLILAIEMFRTTREFEPLSHLVRLLLAIGGALCGGLVTLWLSRRIAPRKSAAASPAEPQNPWSGV